MQKLAVLPLAAVVLVMAGVNSSASAQSVCSRDCDSFSCDAAEGRATTPNSGAMTNSEAPGSDAFPRSPGRPWRGWPGSGDGTRDSSMMNGVPFQGSDGRTCWPHGDHVHCR